MKLIPKALIVGAFGVPTPAPQHTVTVDKLNRVWAEVASHHAYRQMQLGPDGASAEFLGETGDDGVIIRLPLMQVRTAIRMTTDQAAEAAQTVFRSIVRHVGVAQLLNLGIKLVHHGVAPNRDARTYVLAQVMGKSEHDLAPLELGDRLWVGEKIAASAPDGTRHTLVIEPWLADNEYVFIDLDVQHEGAASIDDIPSRVREANEYVLRAVGPYLESLGAGA